MSTTPRERPIIFSGPMVRAILAGKTQTRRVVKPQPPTVEEVKLKAGTDYSWFRETSGTRFRVAGPVWAVRELNAAVANLGLVCPFGDVGDRLWVKEAFYDRADYALIGKLHKNRFVYVADGEKGGWKKHSPIHMPRIASRLTLEITGVRVEPLQSITEEDAIAEGCPGENCVNHPTFGLCTDDGSLPSEQYRELWEQINGKTPHIWAANPWVWVIEFRRVAA